MALIRGGVIVGAASNRETLPASMVPHKLILRQFDKLTAHRMNGYVSAMLNLMALLAGGENLGNRNKKPFCLHTVRKGFNNLG